MASRQYGLVTTAQLRALGLTTRRADLHRLFRGEAAYLHLLDLRALQQTIERANGHHKLTVLQQAIEDWLDGSAGTRSRGEVAFRRAVAALGLPRPLTNRKVLGIEVDFHWPDRKLVVEIDGPNHLRPPTRVSDATRDPELEAAGWTVLRARTYERAIERLAQAVQMPAGGPDSARDGSNRARRATDGPPCKAA